MPIFPILSPSHPIPSILPDHRPHGFIWERFQVSAFHLLILFSSYSPSSAPVSALSFFLISALITVARLALRLRARVFWWDDFWATTALACFATFVPGKPNPPHPPVIIPQIPT